MNVEVLRWPADISRLAGAPRARRAPLARRDRGRSAPMRPTASRTGSRPAPAESERWRAAARSNAGPKTTGSLRTSTTTGCLHHRDHWVSLSPVEQSLAAGAARSVRRGGSPRHARGAGLAARRADPQRARRPRPAAAPPHRPARARDPHRPRPRLPPPGRERQRKDARLIPLESRSALHEASRPAAAHDTTR